MNRYDDNHWDGQSPNPNPETNLPKEWDFASSSIEQNPEPSAAAPKEMPVVEQAPDYVRESMAQSMQQPPAFPEQNTVPLAGQSSGFAYYQPSPAPAEPPKKKKKNTGLVVFLVVLCIAIVAGIVGIAVALSAKDGPGSSTGGSQSGGSGATVDIQDSPTASDTKSGSDELTASGVYKKVADSVVGIEVSTNAAAGGYYGNLGQSTQKGEGSGVLISEDTAKGITYVITCAHVVDGANNIFKVLFKDGSTVDATLVGADSQTDIAVLSIQKTGLTLSEFGDSSKLEVGQTVLAIGNPGGSEFFGSMTQGVVSAIQRPVNSQIGYTTNCIQHDAAINPGNSGGGLFNMYGQLIGINSSKIASTEYEGMGFAVPSVTAKDIVNELISNGYVTGRPQLGIHYNALSNYNNYAQLVAAGVPKGAIVIASVDSGSDLQGKGVQQNDILISVNGKELSSTEVLTKFLSSAKVGDEVKLGFARISNGQVSKFNVTCKLVESKN